MIRRVDPDNDIELYRQYWDWHLAYPRWLRDATDVHAVETFAEFLEQSRDGRVDIGVFGADYKFLAEELVAMISLQWMGIGIYEIHFAAKRGVNIQSLIEPCLNIQKTLFEDLGARFIFAFTPRWNKGAIQLATATGLKVDGVEKIAGVAHGRVIVWTRMSQTRETYELQIQNDADADWYGSAFRGRNHNSNGDAGSEHSRHQPA